MSHPNDAPAAAWYPDPQTPGQVRWWDGANWTEHVWTPPAMPAMPTVATPTPAISTATYIGRHAAGATPAPRQPSTAPRIRPRERSGTPTETRLDDIPSLSYA